MSQSIQNANLVIVGAGLSGIVTAAALADTGCTNVTVLDARPDPTIFETDRAYSQVIYENGLRLIQKLPGLERLFKTKAFCQYVRVVSDVQPDGTQIIKTTKPPAGPVYWILKSAFLELLHAYVREVYPSVTFRNGCSVKDLVMDKEETTLIVTGSKTEEDDEHLSFDVLFACDGSESLLRSLLAQRGDQVDSSHGTAIYSKDSPSAGIRHKGLVLSEEPILSSKGAPVIAATPSVIYSVRGQREGRPAEEVFDLIMLPVSAGTGVRRRAAISMTEGHKLLSVSDVDEMYELFRRNFPQLQVDALISRTEMETFTNTPASSFPAVKRPMSLVAHFRCQKSSSIVFFGDSAHSFPPDAAQGTNSAFQDTEALLDILRQANKKGGSEWTDILKEYEEDREEETWALTRLIAIAAPYQYKQSTIGYHTYMLNKNVRKGLSAVLPGIVHEDVDALIRKGHSFRKVNFLNNLTRFSLALITTSLSVLPVALIRARAKINTESH